MYEDKVVYIAENGSPFPAIVVERREDGTYKLMLEYRQNGDVYVEATEEQIRPWTK